MINNNNNNSRAEIMTKIQQRGTLTLIRRNKFCRACLTLPDHSIVCAEGKTADKALELLEEITRN